MTLTRIVQGREVLIDDDDLETFESNRWRIMKSSTTEMEYCASGKGVLLHRLVLGLTDGAVHADHINRNGLDNRKANLRPCTPSQNQRNRALSKSNRSGYKGVYFDRSRGTWYARYKHNYRNVYLGRYSTALEAGLAYDYAVSNLFGEYARTNGIQLTGEAK